jgi:hypothetical protein
VGPLQVAGSLNITLAVVVAVTEGEEPEFPLLQATTRRPARNAPANKKINQRVPVDVAEPCFAVTTFLPRKTSHIRDRRKAGNRQGKWRETFILCSHTPIRRRPLYEIQASTRHHFWGTLQLTLRGAATAQLGQNVPDHASLPVPLRTHRCYRRRSQAAQWRTSGISRNAVRTP